MHNYSASLASDEMFRVVSYDLRTVVVPSSAAACAEDSQIVPSWCPFLVSLPVGRLSLENRIPCK